MLAPGFPHTLVQAMGNAESERTRQGAARLADVARLAGVSVATVSRALSRPDLLSTDTRDAVQRAITATGYRMNHAARNLPDPCWIGGGESRRELVGEVSGVVE